MGTAAFFMDAGRSADHPEDVLGRVSTFQEGLPVIASDPAGLSEYPRPITRPDIVIIKGISPSALRSRYRLGEKLPRGQEIVLFEVGFGADTQHEAKCEQALVQHSALAQTLTRCGFWVAFQKDLHCIPLGHGGSVYSGLQRLMISLGVSSSDVTRCVGKLAKHAVHYGHLIVRARRQLEAALHTSTAGQTLWTHTGTYMRTMFASMAWTMFCLSVLPLCFTMFASMINL
jgi:hypothetical protein